VVAGASVAATVVAGLHASHFALIEAWNAANTVQSLAAIASSALRQKEQDRQPNDGEIEPLLKAMSTSAQTLPVATMSAWSHDGADVVPTTAVSPGAVVKDGSVVPPPAQLWHCAATEA